MQKKPDAHENLLISLIILFSLSDVFVVVLWLFSIPVSLFFFFDFLSIVLAGFLFCLFYFVFFFRLIINIITVVDITPPY